jgi:sugar lactone lactonase YvrE
MRFFGHHRLFCSDRLPALQLGLFVLLLAGVLSPLRGQAPYVIPYTMGTLAGGSVANGGTTPASTISVGASCAANGKAPYALDTLGDGCPAASVLIASDPHDVRVDNRGNLFYANNSNGMVHKFNPYTLNMSAYVGNLASAASCTKAGLFGTADKYGDGCNATDGVANNSLTAAGTAALYTPLLKSIRGLGLAPNGNLFIASYSDDLIHEVSASSGFFSIVAGTLPAGTATAGSANGPSNGSSVNQPRGVGADASGNVFVADTGNNVIRLVNQFTAPSSAAPAYTPGIVSYYTALNAAKTANTAVGPYASALVNAPEDVKIDGNGNIYIVDFGNNVLRAIYNSKGIGTLPNVPNPVPGYIYVVAGNGGVAAPNTTYPTGGSAPVPALNVQLGSIRKIGIDSHNNVYIADSGAEVVWFLDATTGYLRAIAGSFGQTATSVTTTRPSWVCATSTNAIGDGCPGTQANLDAASNMGVDVDSFGNAYITDSEGGGVGLPRIRKVLSGLNFPATTPSAPITQQILVHLAAGDTPASASPALFRGASDFSLATPTTCTTQPDTTTDCLVTIKFTPSKTGYETSSLSFQTTKNGETLFVLTGVGTTAAAAFDPGNTSLFANVTNPQGVTVDGAGNFYIANTSAGTVTTYLPNGTFVFTYGQGVLKSPTALAFGVDGALYIADPGQNAVYRLDVAHSNTPVLYAGGGTPCSQASDSLGDNCSALNATFNAPSGLAVDNLGNLFVADTGNNVIREIGRNGWVSLFAGGGNTCSATTDSLGNGCPATQATFNKPSGLAFDFTGKYLIVSDTGNSEVRKIYLDATYSYSPASGTPTTATNVVVNPVTLVAGVGQAQSTVNQSSLAALSGLNNPTGVAVDAAENIYIADTGNHAVRLVTPATGVISTIAGILGTSGSGTVPAAATVTQLNAPAAIAVSPLGTLYIADAGNNRVLTDARSSITYNFGRTNVGSSSPVQNITEVNIGLGAVTPVTFTQGTPDPQFTLNPAATSNSSIPACTGTSLASGAACNLQAQFNPAGPGPLSSTFTQVGSNAIGGAPAITLSGTGAVLTPTSATVTQTTPATGNPQFGGPLTFTATVTPTACNTAAPACYPSGTVTFVVDGTPSAPIALTGSGTSVTLPLPSTATYAPTGLAVQTHTISCNYSGDAFYAAFTCPSSNFVVTQANTTAKLTFSPGTSNQPQYPTGNCSSNALPYTCTQTTLVATVASTTVGTPTGTVTFLVNGAPLDGTDVTPIGLNSSGVATLPLTFTVTPNGVLSNDGTLPPGNYNLSCIFKGPSGSNYSGSSCAPVQFTVLPQTASITLSPRGCIASALYPAGSFTAVLGSQCGNGITTNGIPTVATADGSTTDATIFVLPSNTVSGAITFSCSGLPANSACTFQPTSITLTAGTSYASPVYTDVTFFTDVQPGATASLKQPFQSGKPAYSLALIVGWPLTFLGLFGMLALRRKKALRGLSLMALGILMAGSALTFTGCAGPGNYVAALTPAGTYPVTITAKGAGLTSSTIVDFTVTAPGIPGQQ